MPEGPSRDSFDPQDLLTGNSRPKVKLRTNSRAKKVARVANTMALLVLFAGLALLLVKVFVVDQASDSPVWGEQEVEGFWSAWTESPCSVTCGSGAAPMTRKCVPARGNCRGERSRTGRCNIGNCPRK